jgi:hypothetical protein
MFRAGVAAASSAAEAAGVGAAGGVGIAGGVAADWARTGGASQIPATTRIAKRQRCLSILGLFVVQTDGDAGCSGNNDCAKGIDFSRRPD